MNIWSFFLTVGLPSSTSDAAEPPENGSERTVLALQVGHTAPVRHGAFSGNGSLLVTGDREGVVVVRDFATGAILRRFQDLRGPVAGLAVSPRGTYVAASDERGRAKLWNLENLAAPQVELQSLDTAGTRLAFSPDGAQLALATRDHRVGVWDPVTGRRICRLDVHGASVGFVVFSVDGRHLATGDRGGTVALWSAEQCDLLHQVQHPGGLLAAAAFSSDGRRLLVGSGQGTARIWDSATGRQLNVLEGTEGVQAVSFGLEDELALVVSRSGVVSVWNAATGTLVRRHGEPTPWPHSVGPSGWTDGTVVHGVNRNGAVSTWTLRGGELRSTVEPGERASAMNGTSAFSPDGSFVVRLDEEPLPVFDLRRSRLLRPIETRAMPGLSATFSPGGGSLVVHGERVHSNAQIGRQLFPERGWNIMRGAAYAPPGDRQASPGVAIWDLERGTATVWSPRPDDVGSTQEGMRARGPGIWTTEDTLFHWNPRAVRSTYTPDGTKLLDSGPAGLGSLWVLESRRLEHTLQPLHRPANDSVLLPPLTPAVSSDGSVGVTAGASRATAVVWDLQLGKRLLETSIGDAITALALPPVGPLVAVGTHRGRVVVLDHQGGGSPIGIDAHQSPVVDVTFATDGTRLFSTDQNGFVAIWDVRDGSQVRRFRAHQGTLRDIAFSPNGRHAVTAGNDGTSFFWDTSSDQPLAQMATLSDGTWVVVDAAGRFDTADAGTLEGVAWLRPFDPLRALALTTFARTHFVPGLLRRLWTGEKLPQVPDVLDVNVVTPDVRIEARDGALEFDVEVCPVRRTVPTRQGRRELASGARDLLVHLDDRLIYWQDGSLEGNSCSRFTVPYEPPRGTTRAMLSAYAFNDEGIKSATAVVEVPNPAAGETPNRRAFVVSVGVNRSVSPKMESLEYAVADAEDYVSALGNIPDHEVHSVILAEGHVEPTYDNLAAILGVLGGRQPTPRWAPGFERATLDDLVIVTFSGHGTTDSKGAFQLHLGGSKEPGTVSEFQLSQWLKPIVAGDLALVLDSCHSAASVEGEGFVAGPLGSDGFGQLAYDKRVLVLAASQPDGKAREHPDLRNGVLTSSLVHDGLEAGRADPGHDGLTLREWLAYPVRGVPEILRELDDESDSRRANRDPCGQGGCRTGRLHPSSTVAQQPRLFAFRDAGQVPLARGAP